MVIYSGKRIPLILSLTEFGWMNTKSYITGSTNFTKKLFHRCFTRFLNTPMIPVNKYLLWVNITDTETLQNKCAYQELRNVSFSENFAQVLNEWSQRVQWGILNVFGSISKVTWINFGALCQCFHWFQCFPMVCNKR